MNHITILLGQKSFKTTLSLSKYRNGNGLAVALMDEEGPFAIISVNFPPHSATLPPNVFYVKHWSENEPIVPQLMAQNIIRLRDDIPPIQSGFVVSDAYELLVTP